MTTVDGVSPPSRLAEPGEGITEEELRLAGRNHSMPLEALHYDVTPAGMHYLLTHYDIPAIVPESHTVTVDGLVDRPMTMSLDDLRARPRRTQHVTLECAGNGRALLEPRPLSQPWLSEAVGTAEWTGTPLAPILREAGLGSDAHDVVFTGADHGVEKGVEQDFQRGLPLAEALREDILLAYEMNGQPLLPQHGAPLRLVVPGWYGMAHVKWLTRVTVIDKEFDGYQNAIGYRLRQDCRRPRRAAHPHRAARAAAPPGLPRLHVAHPGGPRRPDHSGRPRLVGPWPDHLRRGHRSTAARPGRRPSSRNRVSRTPGGAGAGPGTPNPGGTSWARAPPMPPVGRSRSTRRGTGAASPTTRSSGSRSWSSPTDAGSRVARSDGRAVKRPRRRQPCRPPRPPLSPRLREIDPDAMAAAGAGRRPGRVVVGGGGQPRGRSGRGRRWRPTSRPERVVGGGGGRRRGRSGSWAEVRPRGRRDPTLPARLQRGRAAMTRGQVRHAVTDHRIGAGCAGDGSGRGVIHRSH